MRRRAPTPADCLARGRATGPVLHAAAWRPAPARPAPQGHAIGPPCPVKRRRSTALPSRPAGRAPAWLRGRPADRAAGRSNARVASARGLPKTRQTSPCSTLRPQPAPAPRQISRITAMSWVISTHRQAELAVDVAQQLQDGLRGLRVQRRGGLVAQQDLGLVHQRARDADLLLPGRRTGRGRIGVGLCRAARPGPGALDRAPLCGGSTLAAAQRRAHVLGHRLADSRLKCWKIMPMRRRNPPRSRPARPCPRPRPARGRCWAAPAH